MSGADVLDLVVVGGGPAGALTALHARAAGMDVVVLDRREPPRDKACGEGLMPGGLAALTALGVDVPGVPIRGIRYLDGARHVDARFRHGPGRGARRVALQAALGDALARAGLSVRTAAVRTVDQDETGATVHLADDSPLRARYVVAADGLHSPLRRSLGLDRPTTGRRRFGLRCHVGTAPWTDLVEVHWAPAGEAYVTPVAADMVGVALLGSGRRPFREQLRAFPALRERLAGAEPLSRVLGAGPLRQRSTRRTAGRVLLVGDASGYVDALTGEGVSLGAAQARVVVEALVRDRPQEYERAWHRVTRRHAVATSALLAATRPAATRRLLVPTARAVPTVFRAAVDALAR